MIREHRVTQQLDYMDVEKTVKKSDQFQRQFKYCAEKINQIHRCNFHHIFVVVVVKHLQMQYFFFYV